MISALTSVFSSLIGWVGDFIKALTDSENGVLYGLLPLFAIGIGISLLLVCVKIVRKVVWGA